MTGVVCERCKGRMTEADFEMKRRVCAKLGKPFAPPKVCAECVLMTMIRFAFSDDEPEAWGVFCLGTQQWWPRSFPTQAEAEAHLARCRGPGTDAEVRARERKG